MKTLFQQSLLSLIGFGFFLSTALASPASERPEKPFLSSVPSLFLQSSALKVSTRELTLKPERRLQGDLADKNRLRYSMALQKNTSAPALFVIPGLGGTSETGAALFLAEIAYRGGYSVITVPSTTHWSFALAASESGRTGYLPDDARDLYELLLKIKSTLRSQYGVLPAQWSLLGYSYGALDAAFVRAHDLSRKEFNFRNLIMIAPPLNREMALAKVDQYYNQGANWPSSYKQKLSSFAQGRVLEISRGQRTIDTFHDLEKSFPIKEPAMAWLLANEFRRAILNSAYVGERLEKKKVASVDEAFLGSIGQYLKDKVFIPRALETKVSSATELLRRSELASLLSSQHQVFARGTNLVLFHSTNDYISFPEGESLLKTWPGKAFVYDFGGHLGFLSDQRVIDDLKLVLKTR